MKQLAWFGKNNNPERGDTPGSTSLQRVEQFLFAYDRAGDRRSQYAMALWGIDAAFVKIFGGLDDYHKAEPSKKNRYLQMIGNNALEALKGERVVVAECNKAFLDFLVATQGTPRGKLSGSIANYADRLHGICRFGEREIARVGKMEADVKEFIAADATFAIGTGIVRGAVTEQSVIAASQIIIGDLQQLLVTREHFYRYFIEHYALLRLEPGIRTLLDGVPLFEVEFKILGEGWSKDSARGMGLTYIESIHPAIHTWCQVTVPSLDAGELSLRVIGAAYARYRAVAKSQLDEVRSGYAQLYRDHLFKEGQQAEAKLWNSVVTGLAV